MTGTRTCTARAPTAEGLVRAIRRWDLLFLVLNAVIGAGIFGLPARVFALAGTYSLLAYVGCAAVVALIVLCFAEVASRFRTTGGPYLYAREAFGPAVGFQMGWLLWLARLTAFAALCNLWIDYLGYFVPAVGEGLPRELTITGVVLGLTVMNVRGVRASTVFNDIFTLAKLAPLTLFVVVGAFFVETGNLAPGPPPDVSAFSSAVLLLVFAFSGFEMVVIPAGESRDPRRHAPFALFAGIGFIAVFYVLIQVVSIGTLPELAMSERPLADAAAAFIGPAGGALISAGALISITGTLNVVVLVGPRLPFAMAENGQLPAVFAATHRRFRTPHVSILVSAAVMLVLTLQGSFISALTISTLIRLVTYALTCAALPVLRRREDVEREAFRVPGGWTVSVAATALCGWLITTSGWAEIRTTALAVAAGLVLYVVLGRTGNGGSPLARRARDPESGPDAPSDRDLP